jgi:hypothetical protein
MMTYLKRNLRVVLLLVLAAAAAITFVVAVVLPLPEVFRDISINLSATFIGMVVTVFIVESLIQEAEQQKATRARDHAAGRITHLPLAIFDGFRSSFVAMWPDYVLDATQKMLDADQKLGTHTTQAQALKLMSGCADRSLGAARLADWKDFRIDVIRWQGECNSLLSRWYAGHLVSLAPLSRPRNRL